MSPFLTVRTQKLGRSSAALSLVRRKKRQRGSVIVEFAIGLLPWLAILMLTIDVAWSIFARATLQHAAREGVRFGVTGQILTGNTCLGSSVQQVVAQNSFGFIPASKAATYVSVTYYSPSNLAPVTGVGAAAGGNVIQVSISGVGLKPMGPIFRSSSILPLYAMASDVMESPASGVPPCP